jgi:hypothetical protein
MSADVKAKRRHLPFQAYVIWSAILLGFFGGFGLGAHLVYFLAFELKPGKAFGAMVQVHGHLQLVGWTGLFIIGVSLFKLPRLMSSRPLSENLARAIILSLIVGLLLKSVAQILIFYATYETTLRVMVMLGSLLESSAIILYVAVFAKNSLTFRPQAGAYAAASIKPFLLVSLVSWFAFALVNAAVGIDFARSSFFILSPVWNNLAVEIFIHGVLLPTCFAFSISTFPIFLRLRAPTWPVVRVALLYGVGVFLYLSSNLTEILWPTLVLSDYLGSIGVCLRVAGTFWLLLELDMLRFYQPWFKKFRDNQDRENRPPRRTAGDYGQFGNFEWLIYAAYSWLFLGALSEIAALILASGPPYSVIRHFYLLGFVTHLILGMAVRIVPGFLGKNRIAFPSLVRLSFGLILFATICRTVPVLLPSLDRGVLRFGYGFSGVFAMLAIATLGVNLFVTVRRNKQALSSSAV